MVSSQIFSQSEFNQRSKNLKANLEGIETSIIFCRADLTYYSGIGMDGVLVLDDDLRHYVRRNLPLAKQESNLEVNQMDSYRLFKQLGQDSDVNTLGLELDLLPYKTVEYIKKAYRNPEIIDISQKLRMIRSVKSPTEVKLMKSACKQTDDSFEFIQDKIMPGRSELEISADIEHNLRYQGMILS